MMWLGTPLPMKQQEGRSDFSPRCTKDLIEEWLFFRRRDLFTNLSLIFFDTTTLYFEGNGGETLGRRGHSNDGCPDLNQIVVGAVVDGEGRPICTEIWPGNNADVKTLIPFVNRMKTRFGIMDICIVADRGMISKETIKILESDELRLFYILGARMHKQNEVKDEVLSRAGRYQEVRPEGRNTKAPSPLKVKEVWVDDRRYVVCLNESQAAKDASDRAAIIDSLRQKLRQGDKSLVGNNGYRKYIKTEGSRFSIDEEKIKEASRYDGKWVLRKELQDRIDGKGFYCEWDDVINDLDMLEEMEISQDGKSFLLRSEGKGCCGKVFQAVGVALPPTVRRIDKGTEGAPGDQRGQYVVPKKI